MSQPFDNNEETICNHSGTSQSLWMEIKFPSFPSLEKNLTADVCIVGSGIAGLTCAYTLAKQGKSVIVLDLGAIAGGQSARTTAHLTWALDDHFCELEKLFGEEGAKIAAQSHSAAIDYIEKIIFEEKIECDFQRVDGYLLVPPEDPQEILDKELAAIKKTGMEVEKVAQSPLSQFFHTGPCLYFPRQAQFHILKYLKGLTHAIIKNGGKIFSHSRVNHFEDGNPCIIKTASGAIVSSQSVIVATCTPINDLVYIHTKQAAYRTYVIATPIRKGLIPNSLHWETSDPYHYIRIQRHLHDPELDWLIIGGEDHKTGQDPAIEEKYIHLENWSKKRFPFINHFPYHWSGQVFEPVDSLGFIGRNPGDQNTYVATGDSGNGMTHGTIAGMLIPDLIQEKKNLWENLYRPSRKTLSAAPEFLHENLNALIQYKDWLTPGEQKKIETLAPTEGMILREGLKKIAVYKDKENHVYIHSAVCPHLKGCLRWNFGEKSWDCPVHGSRFDGYGTVLNGPTYNNLCPHEEKV